MPRLNNSEHNQNEENTSAIRHLLVELEDAGAVPDEQPQPAENIVKVDVSNTCYLLCRQSVQVDHDLSEDEAERLLNQMESVMRSDMSGDTKVNRLLELRPRLKEAFGRG
jgi:hypothetical protein